MDTKTPIIKVRAKNKRICLHCKITMFASQYRFHCKSLEHLKHVKDGATGKMINILD